MNISIIIITWNGDSLTKRCMDSLKIKELPLGVEIIIVDNGSTDDTLSVLKLYNGIKIIENHENLGYGAAVNIGIRNSKDGSDIVLLNNDLFFIDTNWLSKLAEHSANFTDHGVIGVKILRENGLLQHCGAYLPMDTWWGQQVAGGECDIGQYSGVVQCESVVFACVYIKRCVLESIGLFDERFFAYFEDTDFCLRATRAGFKVVMNGDVRVVHAESSSTKVNKVSHSDIFLKSQASFKDKWEGELSHTRYNKGGVDFRSIVNFPSGYASSARSLIEMLDKEGVRVAYKYVFGPGTNFPIEEPKRSDSYIVNSICGRTFGNAEVQVVYAHGDVFEKNSGKYKIGFTMLEVDGLPSEWVRQANLMDEIWVPSAFNKQTFKQSGVNVPIYVVPLGVDPAYFSPKIIGSKPKGVFSFLSVFEWGERKAPELLMKAFSDEFDASEDVVLICKVNNFDPAVNIETQVDSMRLRPRGGRIVIAKNRILKRYELGVLYRSADCFVLPTRGEGWGMPILEAMACGIPVIATKWSSQLDFMTDGNSYPLEVDSLVPAVAKCPYYQGFNWAQPSYEHLRYLMRKVFENQREAKTIGEKAASDAHGRWSWQNSAQKIISRLNYIRS